MEEAIHDILKVYFAQIQSAIKISEIICEPANREELTGDDIICGLVYRLMTPIPEDEVIEALNTAEDLLNEDSEEEDEIVVIYDPPEIPRKIKSNQCNCDICCNVRVCLCNYHDYEPLDTLANRFKNSIQETCDKHKIFI